VGGDGIFHRGKRGDENETVTIAVKAIKHLLGGGKKKKFELYFGMQRE